VPSTRTKSRTGLYSFHETQSREHDRTGMNDSPLRARLERENRLLHLTLARPKANIVDAVMIAALQQALDSHRDRPELAAVLLDAEGPHFSFGASVEEHLPAQCEQMLRSLHRLVLTEVEYPVPILVAADGLCLGGGMEVAIAASLLFAGSKARFGQPEIQLAVFAPAASCLLPARIGYGEAFDLLVSGRSIDAAQAERIGLARMVSDDPVAAALAYFDEHLAPRSSCALRHATWAASAALAREVRTRLAEVEARYLEQLMASEDAVEGLTAFLDKRTPRWRHR